MAARVTIQDIADELGLSRNTVSKALNNTGILADATKDRILRKAAEMGYKQFSYMNITGAGTSVSAVPQEVGEIALFTTMFLGTSHFASLMLDKFQKEISQLGFSLTMYRVLGEEIRDGRLPSAFNKERTAGILCIELFDYDYCRMVCDLGLPVLMVDSPTIGLNEPLKADALYMNNTAYIQTFIKEMARRGKTEIGYIGDILHCQSFLERYLAYRNGLFLTGLPCREEYSIISRTDFVPTEELPNYSAYLVERLKQMKKLPEVFICANDFAAIDTIDALKKLGKSVPDDVWLCGFDDAPEARLITPRLTTIHIHTQIMGMSAANLLISRIAQPSMNFRTVYAESNLIYRASTGD